MDQLYNTKLGFIYQTYPLKRAKEYRLCFVNCPYGQKIVFRNEYQYTYVYICIYWSLNNGHSFRKISYIINIMFYNARKSAPLVKVNSTYMKHKVWPRHPCCSTNWDRKDWPGSENQMYYDCPWKRKRKKN